MSGACPTTPPRVSPALAAPGAVAMVGRNMPRGCPRAGLSSLYRRRRSRLAVSTDCRKDCLGDGAGGRDAVLAVDGAQGAGQAAGGLVEAVGRHDREGQPEAGAAGGLGLGGAAGQEGDALAQRLGVEETLVD